MDGNPQIISVQTTDTAKSRFTLAEKERSFMGPQNRQVQNPTRLFQTQKVAKNQSQEEKKAETLVTEMGYEL